MGRLEGWNLKEKVNVLVPQVLLYLRDYPVERRDLITIDLVRQLVRSCASIGANLAEAEVAISDKEFCRILWIVVRETNESLYWMKLLQEIWYTVPQPYIDQATEVLKIVKVIIGKIKNR